MKKKIGLMVMLTVVLVLLIQLPASAAGKWIQKDVGINGTFTTTHLINSF